MHTHTHRKHSGDQLATAPTQLQADVSQSQQAFLTDEQPNDGVSSGEEGEDSATQNGGTMANRHQHSPGHSLA